MDTYDSLDKTGGVGDLSLDAEVFVGVPKGLPYIFVW